MSKNEETVRENELRAYEQVLNGTCGLGYADCSLVDFARGLKYFIDAESRKSNGDTHLIAVLQRAVCIGWELSRTGNRPLDRPDPDPRLEQAREALNGKLKCGHNPSNIPTCKYCQILIALAPKEKQS